MILLASLDSFQGILFSLNRHFNFGALQFLLPVVLRVLVISLWVVSQSYEMEAVRVESIRDLVYQSVSLPKVVLTLFRLRVLSG